MEKKVIDSRIVAPGLRAVLSNALVALVLSSCFALARNASASNVQFNVTIKELPPALAPSETLIKAHVITAARMWTDAVDAKPCQIEIALGIRDVVEGDPKKLGYGKSTRTVTFEQGSPSGKIISEQGWASALRTGRHPKDGEPDLEIGFQTAYVLREFWWDPDPTARKARIPPGKLDALSVILHELGHAIAFNGWINPTSGKLSGNFISTYDRWVRWDGHDFYFEGPIAKQVYGKPILLGHTVNTYHHLGDERQGVATDIALKNDLMTAYHLQWAKRYSVTPLDIAILKDCGIQMK